MFMFASNAVLLSSYSVPVVFNVISFMIFQINSAKCISIPKNLRNLNCTRFLNYGLLVKIQQSFQLKVVAKQIT